MEEALSLAWLPKAVVYGLGQLAVGIVVVRRLSQDSDDDNLETYLTRLARVVAAVVVLALGLRLWVQTASAFGLSDASFANLHLVAIESRWGRGWRWQMIASAALLVSVVAIPHRRLRWTSFKLGAFGLALAMPLLGHAAGSWPRYLVHVAHNLAAAMWIGTLGVLTVASWRSQRGAAIGVLVRAFSPVALTSSCVAFASGTVAAYLYVGTWSALAATSYGRVLLLKLGAVALITGCGWTNWRTVRRGQSPRHGLMAIEWILALLVVGLTGLLTETEHP